MTRIVVNPGACGFICRIEVAKAAKYRVSVSLESGCEQIGKLREEVKTMDFMEILRAPHGQNSVSLSGARCGLHPSCPVPSGLLKAAEAELGLAVKKDVSFIFGNED